MYNTKFTSIAESLKMNGMTEKELVMHLQRYFENQNYRTDYNKRKNELQQLLKDDPIVKERAEALRKARAK